MSDDEQQHKCTDLVVLGVVVLIFRNKHSARVNFYHKRFFCQNFNNTNRGCNVFSGNIQVQTWAAFTTKPYFSIFDYQRHAVLEIFHELIDDAGSKSDNIVVAVSALPFISATTGIGLLSTFSEIFIVEPASEEFVNFGCSARRFANDMCSMAILVR
ncbi:hypothetical protein T11_7501 [Trichinella zimbabwensis]|uniref:Uncharacterized protein n=1 Tax=Trichinella zimbabwensis TaxID=268475 RepID=A0A0V1HIF6_9BILA|nr:hypothetical protein T11_7501 [Trichinella zimbabwensis]